MRDRLAALNPKASAKIVNRLIEATDRRYWSPDPATLERPAPRRARTSKTASKASKWRWPHDAQPCRIRSARPSAGRRRQRPGRARPGAQDRHRQGVRRLRQGRHRQEHDLLQPVGRVQQARQARAADRLRPEARQHLHADQAAAAHRDRRAGDGELPLRGAARRGLRLPGLQRRDVRRGGRPAGRHRLRRLRGRPDGEAAQGAPPAGRDRRGDLRRAGRRGVRRLRRAAAARRPRADRHRQRLRQHLRDEPHRRRDQAPRRRTTTSGWAA